MSSDRGRDARLFRPAPPGRRIPGIRRIPTPSGLFAAPIEAPLDIAAEGDEVSRMSQEHIRDLVEEATFDYTMGDHAAALEKLERALQADADCFEAWHAKTEIHFSLREFENARLAAERALAIRPEDVHIHTSLSRIHMELGNKATAEKHGTQARMLGWKEELRDTQRED